MTQNNSKFFLGTALFLVITLSFSFGKALFVSADENSGYENAEERDGGVRSPLLRAQDLARERKLQIEQDSERKRALMEGETGGSGQSEVGKNLCTNLIERNLKMGERLLDMQKKISERKATRKTVFDEKRDARDATLKEKREERDAKREEMYARLLERAGNDTEKQKAVAAFKTAVEKAITDRKTAVDAAIAAFRTGVDTAIGTRKNALDVSMTSFKTSADKAFATAKNSCEAGEDPKTVRETLQADLKSARSSAQSDRQEAEKIGEQVKALAETKKAAFATALADFKLAIETARKNLKAAFGTKTETTGAGE